MLRRSLSAVRYAFDVLRRSFVHAAHAAGRAGGSFYRDGSCREPLVLVRKNDSEPHFRRFPRRRSELGPPPLPAGVPTPHQRAVRRLWLELACGEGLSCLFLNGSVSMGEALALFGAGTAWHARAERGIQIDGRRFIPDLVVSCPVTAQHLLVIEVRASHAIGSAKQQAYASAGLPWIEVSAAHVCNRRRRAPLCAEIWGGSGFPALPEQGQLFQTSTNGFPPAEVRSSPPPVRGKSRSWLANAPSRAGQFTRSRAEDPPRERHLRQVHPPRH